MNKFLFMYMCCMYLLMNVFNLYPDLSLNHQLLFSAFFISCFGIPHGAIDNIIAHHKTGMNNIVFYTDDGEKLRSPKAIFNMNNDIIELKEDVSHESVRGLIISDTSVISENFNKIVYNGNVKTIIKDTD